MLLTSYNGLYNGLSKTLTSTAYRGSSPWRLEPTRDSPRDRKEH